MKLELGSGYSPTPGYMHLDVNPDAPDVDIVSLAYPLDLPDESVDEIRAVDVLEHLPYRQTDAALAEWCRVLRSGGELFVQVPDADLIMRWYVEHPAQLVERIPADLPQTPLAGAAWRLLGGQDDDVCAKSGDDWRWNSHFSLFSVPSLAAALRRAGFNPVSTRTNGHPNILATAVKP